ncbi:DMT family transporter [Tabrizicola sp.]|uniref:DMT family transporter n=1 Tax=Tabrizicola sp. TaxID=2005166 RepID=UPI0027345E6E|nr:DMT family transporter [Tabrizicola sp.]MDP3193693.1 DMT family transporter [Tabrizicola sp.]
MRAVNDLGRPLEGALWMAGAGLSFVGVNGIVRYLGTELPAAQSAFIRFGFGLLFLLPALWAMRGMRFGPGVGQMFLGRGALHVVAVIMWFYAMARVPVAEMAAIAFLGPVMVLVIGGLLLGEGLGARRVAAVLVAVVGGLIVLRPGVRELSLGHLSQLGATIFFAMSYIIAKRLSREASASSIVAVLSVTVTVGLLPLAVAQWQPVRWEQCAWLAAVAALATLGHYAMAKAFRAAPLAVTQPVTFLQLIWAALLGLLAFGEPVEPWVLAGGALIILAISVNTWAEARRERATPALVEDP